MDAMDSMRFAPAGAGGDRRVRNHRNVVLQLIEAAVGDNVPGIDAVNLREPAVRNSRLYAAHMSEIVLNDVDERCLAVLLNGRGWN
jgi:hypothetical protein